MKYFRVDKRNFSAGDVITTANQYYSEFHHVEKVIEDELEKLRPLHKKERKSCLFVFEEELCAKNHWSNMTNGKLYEVQIDKENILHRGDMALMDEMKALYERKQDMKKIAQKYWNGDISKNPEIEILVHEAKVIKVISNSEYERKTYFGKKYGYIR